MQPGEVSVARCSLERRRGRGSVILRGCAYRGGVVVARSFERLHGSRGCGGVVWRCIVSVAV